MKVAEFGQTPGTIEPALVHRVGVVGGGAWGTALAAVAGRAGRDVTLWCRRQDVAAEINRERRNRAHLGDIALPEGIDATTDMEALAEVDAVLLVTPSQTTREMARALAPLLRPGTPVALCAKGVEEGSGLLLSQVVAEEAPTVAVGALSGPTFAHEAARGFPSAVTVAFELAGAPETAIAARMALAMTSECFRPYVSDDVVGVEVGGAVKNVIAIACGMTTGAGFAENTRAALIARGVDEMKALAEALGGRRETVTGLSGVGDLTLTCSSTSSRNMRLGVQLGEGLARADCFGGEPVVVEGERNALSVTDLARKLGVAMPISEAVRAILHEGAAIGETFAGLWAAPLEAEPRAIDLTLDHPSDEDAVRRFAESMP